MEPLGIGVIGLGMGAGHLQACVAYPRSVARAICDPDEGRLAAGAQIAPDAVAVADYREVIERSDVDAVVIASPDFDHAEQCVAALRAGKHVLCEKPLALTVEDCQAIVEAAEGSGLRFMIAQVCRFAPGFVRTKELVEAGAVGELFLVESEYAHNYTGVGGVGNWRCDPSRPRPAVIGGGCHAVDLLRWVAGDVAEVTAYANHRAMPEWPVDDCTVAVLRFKSGAIGRLMVSIGCRRDYTMRSTFYGNRGTIISDNTSPTLTLYTGEPGHAPEGTPGPGRYDVPMTIPVGDQTKPVATELEAFVDAVLDGGPIPMDAREGARTIATCVAIVESAARGCPVAVSEAF
jgi:UDP-N-acetylglucosamine 3-dehydrogenase